MFVYVFPRILLVFMILLGFQNLWSKGTGSAIVWERLKTGESVWKHLRPFWKQSPTSARLCQALPVSARLCPALPDSARLCEALPGSGILEWFWWRLRLSLALACSRLLSLALTCSCLLSLEWELRKRFMLTYTCGSIWSHISEWLHLIYRCAFRFPARSGLEAIFQNLA